MTPYEIYLVLHSEVVSFDKLQEAIDKATAIFEEEGIIVSFDSNVKALRNNTAGLCGAIGRSNIMLIGFSYSMSVSQNTAPSRAFVCDSYEGRNRLVGFL